MIKEIIEEGILLKIVFDGDMPLDVEKKLDKLSLGTSSKMRKVWNISATLGKVVEFLPELNQHYSKALKKEAMIEDVYNRDTITGLDSSYLSDSSRNLRVTQQKDITLFTKILNLNGGIIANEMRTGKTPTSIGVQEEWFKTNKNGNVVFVVPNHVIGQFEKEIQLWSGRVPIIINHSNKSKRLELWAKVANKSGEVFITTHSKVGADYKSFPQFDKDKNHLLIVDEAHFLRNHRTLQSEGMKTLASKCGDIYALTGTPAVNGDEDFIRIAKFIWNNIPVSLATDYFFSVDEWNHFSYNKVPASYKMKKSKEDEWKSFLHNIASNRKQVGEMLESNNIDLKMNDKQKITHDLIIKDKVASDKGLSDTPTMKSYMDMRKCELSPNFIEGSYDNEGAKVEWVIDYIRNNKGKKIVITSFFKSFFREYFYDILKVEFPELIIDIMDGDVSSKVKEQIRIRFQDSDLDILLLQSSINTGLTLSKAHTIIFMDKSWLPAENEQLQARIWSTGNPGEPSTKEKKAYYLTCVDGYDAFIEKTNIKKQLRTIKSNNFKEEEMLQATFEDYLKEREEELNNGE